MGLYDIALALALVFICKISPKIIEVSLSDSKHKVTEKEYISFTLDAILLTNETSSLPWAGLDFNNPSVLALAEGLSPAHLRFGGGPGDRVCFAENEIDFKKHACFKPDESVLDKPPKPSFPIPIYPKGVDGLLKLAHAASGKLLFGLNIRPRLPNGDWDPSNALRLMTYINNVTTGPVSEAVGFELGNENPYFDYHPSPERMGKDFINMKTALDGLPEYAGTWILGPDTHGINHDPKDWGVLLEAFVKVSREIDAHAVTVHHYYMKGTEAQFDDYRNVTVMQKLASEIQAANDFIEKGGRHDLPLWIGETADANHHGCLGKTDRFLSSFMWMDKIGLAAENGVRLLARQDFYGLGYPLINSTYYPNSDYWVSYIYKQLVGEVVLFPTMSGSTVNSTRLYAHCTATKAAFPLGSVTFFGLNLADEVSPSIQFNLPSDTIALYLLTSDGPLTSQGVLLNGKKLDMLEDGTKFPDIKPVTVSSQEGIKLPPASLFFAVVPDANVKLCL